MNRGFLFLFLGHCIAAVKKKQHARKRQHDWGWRKRNASVRRRTEQSRRLRGECLYGSACGSHPDV